MFSREKKWSKSDLENVRFWVTEMTPQTTPKMTPWGDPKIVDFWSDVAVMNGTQDHDIVILYPYGLELVNSLR